MGFLFVGDIGWNEPFFEIPHQKALLEKDIYLESDRFPTVVSQPTVVRVIGQVGRSRRVGASQQLR